MIEMIRPNIRALKPYESARSLKLQGDLFLDANESPWGEYRRYPNPQPQELLERLADYYGVRNDQICVLRGSDEALDVILRTLCEPGQDPVMICPPTYGMYQVSSQIHNSPILEVPLRADFSLDIPTMLETGRQAKVIFVCSPNNPTGNAVTLSEIETLCETLSKAVIVVDEAYGEFSEMPSAIPLIDKFPNLMVLRTLSKAWGLAGLRVGSVLCQSSWIEYFHRVRAPYPLPQPCVELALQTLAEPEKARAHVSEIKAQRKWMAQALEKLGMEVFPSEANYILVRTPGARRLFEFCLGRGLVLRDRGKDRGLSDCVRITVGTETQNARVLSTIGEWKAQA